MIRGCSASSPRHDRRFARSSWWHSCPADRLHPSVAAKIARAGRLGKARREVELRSCGNGHARRIWAERCSSDAAGMDMVQHSLPRLRAGARRPARRAGAGRRNTVANTRRTLKSGSCARRACSRRGVPAIAPRRSAETRGVGYPRIDVDQWYAILARRATPGDAIATLNREFARVRESSRRSSCGARGCSRRASSRSRSKPEENRRK